MNIFDKLIFKTFDCTNSSSIHISTTYLHNASRLGHTTLVKYLIHSGIDVNTQDHNGYTALHFAAMSGHKNIVKLLCKHKADISIQGDCGLTPLDAALIHNYTKIVKYLHKHQDSISVQDNFAVTTLTTTLKSDNTNSDALDPNILGDIDIHVEPAPLLG